MTRLKLVNATRREGESAKLATGHLTLCFVDKGRGRPMRAPDVIRDKLATLAEAAGGERNG